MATLKPRNQKQVLAGLDMLNGRIIRKLSKSHDRDIVAPIRAAIGKAKSNKGLLGLLGKATFRAMDSKALERAAENGFVQAGGIGLVAAMPRQTGKRRNVETSKRPKVETSK